MNNVNDICTSSKVEENDGLKRSFLDVNKAEKYKNFILKPLKTKKLKPSGALDRVKEFLPSLKLSNEKLLETFQQNPNDLNIENVNEDEQFIEMNLAFVPDEDDSDEDDSDSNNSQKADSCESDSNEEKDTENDKQKTSLHEFLDKLEVPTLNTQAVTLEKTQKIKNRPTISIIEETDQNDD